MKVIHFDLYIKGFELSQCIISSDQRHGIETAGYCQPCRLSGANYIIVKSPCSNSSTLQKYSYISKVRVYLRVVIGYIGPCLLQSLQSEDPSLLRTP